MSWKSILKISLLDARKIEWFSKGLLDLLDRGFSKINYTLGYHKPKQLDLNNPNDLIFLAKTGVTLLDSKGNLQHTGSEDKGFDLTNLSNLNYFISIMKKGGYDMEMFNTKGLLTQGSSGGTSQMDYTRKIKDAVNMLTRMNKPITKESVMYETDMEENQWDEKYDKLLE